MQPIMLLLREHNHGCLHNHPEMTGFIKASLTVSYADPSIKLSASVDITFSHQTSVMADLMAPFLTDPIKVGPFAGAILETSLFSERP